MIRTSVRLIAAAALGGLVHTGVSSADDSCERVEYVMGTMLRVTVTATSRADACTAVDSAFAVVHRLDSLLSNYRPDSDISRLAQRAPEPVTVAPIVFDFIQETLTWAHASGGVLNPAIGPVVELWGFYGEAPSRPEPAALKERAALCDLAGIELDSATAQVRLRQGMQFDPGATGKGFALRAADWSVARITGTRTILFDFGGQIYYRGDSVADHAVLHPRGDSALASVVRFAHGSLATSGDYERYFEQDGIRYAHILDPRTAQPVQGRAAVTVFARDPFVADALSTALFVLGPEEGAALLDRYPGSSALFAEWAGDSIRFVTAGRWDTLETR